MVNSLADTLFCTNETEPEWTSAGEIKLIILKKIGSKGSPGQDGITNRALKNLPPSYYA